MKIEEKILSLGREKVHVYYDNFEYFQPNKHKCGDCHIRCVCAATGMSWLDVFDSLYVIARKNQVPLGSTENLDVFLKEKGYKWVAVKPQRGESRPTVADFAESHKSGTYVLRVSSHVVGGRNGKYMDIWDCGDKSLYGYWYKGA